MNRNKVMMKTKKQKQSAKRDTNQRAEQRFPTIIEALDDLDLFGSLIFGESWSNWKIFLKALFALPMTEAELAIAAQATGRSDLAQRRKPFRFATCICGRRAGKDRIASVIAVYLATLRDYSHVLSPGEKGIVMLLAQDRAGAHVALDYIADCFRLIPLFRKMVAKFTKDSIILKNNIRIEVHTSD